MEKSTKPAKQAKPKRFHLSGKDREYLTNNLALLLGAGVPIGEAFESLKETGSTRLFKNALTQIQHDIDDGLPLWKALDRSGVMTSGTLALIRLGEESGSVVSNLEVAAKQEEKQRMFRAKIRSALLYPGFVLSVTGIVGLGVAWFLLPKLSVTFGQLNVPLPLISKIFINLGLFLKRDGLWAVPSALASLVAVFVLLFAVPGTKRIGNWLVFHLPGISRLLYEVEIARFGYLFGTLLEAGLSVPQSLELLERSTTANRYKQFYRFLHDAVEEGWSFQVALKKYTHSKKLLPPSLQQMIIAGERSGSLPKTLLRIGTIYEEKSEISTQNLEVIIEPVLLVIVAAGVMGVAVAVILPIYKLVGGLNT